MVEPRKKLERLVEVLRAEEPEQAIIFCRTKIGAAQLGEQLADRGLASAPSTATSPRASATG